jgi:hypothetical protein
MKDGRLHAIVFVTIMLVLAIRTYVVPERGGGSGSKLLGTKIDCLVLVVIDWRGPKPNTSS